MALQTVTLQLVGIAPLLHHNNRLANPLDNYTKALQKLTSKRNKTEVDHLDIARLEWEGGLYLHDGEAVIPSQNIMAVLWQGAKKSKRGPKIKSGITFQDLYVPLEYKGPRIKITASTNGIPMDQLDKFYPHHNFQTLAKAGGGRTGGGTVLRTRPCFHDWSLKTTIIYDDSVVEATDILKAAEDSGRLIGLGDYRPTFGRFMAEVI